MTPDPDRTNSTVADLRPWQQPASNRPVVRSTAHTTIYSSGSPTKAAIQPPSRPCQRAAAATRVHVLYATPGTPLAQQKQAAERANMPLILGPDHPLAKQAFQHQ
jgi:hypothetical protein